MKWIVGVLVALVSLTACAQTSTVEESSAFEELADGSCNSSESRLVEEHISGQITALSKEDWKSAYSFAAPGFQKTVGLDQFIFVITSQYQMLINNQGVAQRTAKEVPYKFDIGPSPYIHLSKQFEEFAAYPEPSFATLETNKGCPYKCTFCDWGSLTYSKVKKFNLLLKSLFIGYFCRIMARLLTGIQSTGTPHLGNLLGAIIPSIDLSKFRHVLGHNAQF